MGTKYRPIPDGATPRSVPAFRAPAVSEVCSACSSGYGRGAANQCHLCSESFKGGMIFLLSVMVLAALAVVVLLSVYLVRHCRCYLVGFVATRFFWHRG